MGIFDKIIHGGPQTQERKKAEAEAKAEARKVELAAYREGLLIGAKRKGKAEGIAKGERRGGLMGTIERIGAGAQAMERTAGPLMGDINLGGIGGGLNVDSFGMGGGSSTRRTRQKRRNTRRRGR